MHRSTDDLLYDSEAALRLVDTALHELHGVAAEPAGETPEPAIDPDLGERDAEPPDHAGKPDDA